MNYDPGTVELWSLISNVQGCDCCLKNTATVGSCLKVDRDCGPSYCNCDGADPSCAVPEPSLTEVLTDWSNNDTCTCGAYYLGLVRARRSSWRAGRARGLGAGPAPGRRRRGRRGDVGAHPNAALPPSCAPALAPQAEKSPETQAANSLLKLECNGMLDEGGGRCSEGKAPLISVTTLHQIHIFIFCVRPPAALALLCVPVLRCSRLAWFGLPTRRCPPAAAHPPPCDCLPVQVAMAHVLMGVIMVLLASYRLHLWRKLCPEEDDEHAAQARRGACRPVLRCALKVRACGGLPSSSTQCLPCRLAVSLAGAPRVERGQRPEPQHDAQHRLAAPAPNLAVQPRHRPAPVERL